MDFLPGFVLHPSQSGVEIEEKGQDESQKKLKSDSAKSRKNRVRRPVVGDKDFFLQVG